MGNNRPPIEHGAALLPRVSVDSYNLEIKGEDGWIGDQASRTAFWNIARGAHKTSLRRGYEPFEGRGDVSQKNFDWLLKSADARKIAFALDVIEEFAVNLCVVIQRFLKSQSWEKVEAIVLGGGLQDSLAGRTAVERAAIMLHKKKLKLTLLPIVNDPDDAGLIGAAELVPLWMLRGFDGMLAVDIGGTNIRAGVVKGNFKSADSRKYVWHKHVWRHCDDTRSRTVAVDEIAGMLIRLDKRARRASLNLAPVIGVGCPGIIERDGAIRRGAQNLPGNWASENFNLADALSKGLGTIQGHDAVVIVHNDAVLQGLSELPRMATVNHWAVLTIGTGLGNAKFSRLK